MPQDPKATHTVQLFTKNGLTKVVGVTDVVKRDALIRYIAHKGGEKENDWYRFFEDKDLLDVVDEAKELDSKAEVYNVKVRGNAVVGGTFVVLFHLSGSSEYYELSAKKTFDQKKDFESHIAKLHPVVTKEFDWYRVGDTVPFRIMLNAGAPVFEIVHK